MGNLLKPYGADGNAEILAKAGVPLPPPPPAPPTPGGKGGGPGIAVDLMAKKGEGKGGIIDVRRGVMRKSALLAPQPALMAKKGGRKGGPVADIRPVARKSALLAPQSAALMAKKGEGKGGIRLVESKSLIAMAGKSGSCPANIVDELRQFAPRQVVRASARD